MTANLDIDSLKTQRSFFQASIHAANTQDAYSDDFSTFEKWCNSEGVGRQALPATPDTLTLFLTYLLKRGNKVSTAARRARGIAWTHKSHGFDSPINRDARELLTGARRIRLEQPRQMRPLTTPQIRAIAAMLDQQKGWIAARNRAIIITGFASALRRCNLSALDVADLTFSPEGVQVRVKREKTDQYGKGRSVPLPRTDDPLTCPVRTLENWIAVRPGQRGGPLFVSQQQKGRLCPDRIWAIVKASVRAIGVEGWTEYSPHSLRAGMITTAGENGVNHLVIAAHTGHRSMSTLQRYFRPQDPWKAPCAAMLGL